ncbi:uncharacterized protein BO97DRAFT_274518 [Aspergillus homomorphus CBS 101889]|uniref:Uncharacterized protein n=1 Tax=Aspergillus homomorphus (strain CBS 101889) TaxID=1450537 RepID=A0A395I4Y7_ASPHC|nr:hypothetical protein BO97DRAFT_274518 [Aspergillus homomorphus CBS 101889]RAL14643.1 hypothetical protein BO97DRAFT_274518 [Aspergillus homomorphus CBS 101889]
MIVLSMKGRTVKLLPNKITAASSPPLLLQSSYPRGIIGVPARYCTLGENPSSKSKTLALSDGESRTVRYGNGNVRPTMTLFLPCPSKTPSAARCDGDIQGGQTRESFVPVTGCGNALETTTTLKKKKEKIKEEKKNFNNRKKKKGKMSPEGGVGSIFGLQIKK